MEIVYKIAFWWTMMIWTIIGFLCWIPLLTRMTAVFSTRIIISAISQSEDDGNHLRSNFEDAIGFYLRGFNYIYRVFNDRDRNRRTTTGTMRRDPIKWGRVCIELSYTVIFWGGLFFVLSKLFSPHPSPLDS
jgi:hypothetical protein